MHLLLLHLDHPERFLSSGKQLAQAFAKIPAIDELVISEAGNRSRTFLKALSADVQKVHIEYYCTGDEEDKEEDPTIRNPIVHLKGICQTLTTLTGEWFDVDNESDPTHDIVYPNLRHLEITTFDTVNIGHFTVAFPNLTSLVVYAGENFLDPVDEENTRAANQEVQVEHGRWSRLERLKGSVTDIWPLAMDCEVESVDLCMILCRNAARFRDVIADVRPVHLSALMNGSVVCEPDFSTALREDGHRLRTMQLNIDFLEMDCDLDGNAMLTSLIHTLSTLTLTAFKLRMNCTLLRRTYGYSILRQDRAGTPDLHEIERFLVELDVEALADRLQGNVPSLQSLTVELLVKMGGRGEVTLQRGPLAEFP
ncbi:hypothetical protein C8Q80DRAFT_1160240 [Daedaleopsis nitida]|nr:hypothetical protein C8Q80DRAFT_1160240 [Daedaleopsis nitida]